MACQPDSVPLSNPAMRTISTGDSAMWPTTKYLFHRQRWSLTSPSPSITQHSQIHVIQLKSCDPQQKQRKCSPKARVDPIVRWTSLVKFRYQIGGPDPPGTLQPKHGDEGDPGNGLELHLFSVQKCSEKIAGNDGHDPREKRAQRSSAHAEPKWFIGKHDGFRVDSLADQGNDEKEFLTEKEFGGQLQFS